MSIKRGGFIQNFIFIVGISYLAWLGAIWILKPAHFALECDVRSFLSTCLTSCALIGSTGGTVGNTMQVVILSCWTSF